MDNKYADIRIPLRETKNYAVDFTGNYSSVYGNFEKVPVTVKEKESETAPSSISGSFSRNLAAKSGLGSVWTTSSSNGPSKFTAVVGDGKGLKVDMKCQNCTVDFK